MAPHGKKATFIAPGKIGLSRGQGLKATFLPGGLFKASPSDSGDILSSKSTKITNKLASIQVSNAAVVREENQVPNVQVSKLNENATNEAAVEEVNPPVSTFIESLNEDINQNDLLQRSNNNDSFSKFLDLIEPETDATIREEASATTVTRKRNHKPDAKPRGVNKCKKVANLKQGQKLEVEFYNNGPVGENHTELTRHMGKLVRDRTICPVRVHSWNDIEDNAKEHMWQSVLNKFAGKGYPLDRKTSIEHMRRLWHNWRGILNQNSIIKKGGPKNALKKIPNDLTKEDWEWLVKEHFSSTEFKKVSARNSGNRENLTMPHRTGSKPFRQIIWDEMGGKQGNGPPPISAVFKRTRQRKSGNLAEDEAAKYDEIVAVEKDNPSLSHFEVVEKCFGEQDRGSVACFGFGVRPKDVRGPLPSRFELTTSLHEKQRENDDLKKRLDEMEKKHEEEREAERKKMSTLEEKIDLFMTAYLCGDNTNSNIS